MNISNDDLCAFLTLYLAHPDSMVRSDADWALEHFGLRRLRGLRINASLGHAALLRLANRLVQLQEATHASRA